MYISICIYIYIYDALANIIENGYSLEVSPGACAGGRGGEGTGAGELKRLDERGPPMIVFFDVWTVSIFGFYVFAFC